MDPWATLERAKHALDLGELHEAEEALRAYGFWRAKGGFEPAGGDAFEARLREAFRQARDSYMATTLTVGELRDALEGLDDDMPVVTSALPRRIYDAGSCGKLAHPRVIELHVASFTSGGVGRNFFSTPGSATTASPGLLIPLRGEKEDETYGGEA